MSTNTVNVTLPGTNVDGSSLALSDIASFAIAKNGGTPVVVQGPFTTAAQVYTDSSPDFGSTDSYSVTVTEADGETSAPAVATVVVPSAEVPSAPTVTATFNP